jgi:hypothetical protein
VFTTGPFCFSGDTFMKLGEEARTFLVPNRATASGGARIDATPDLCRWHDPGDLVWSIEVPDSDQYSVDIAYSLSIDTARYQILLDGTVAGEGNLRRTSGFFIDQTPSANYELHHHSETLALTDGDHQLAIRIQVTGDPAIASLCDLRLTPVSAVDAINAEDGKALDSRADLAWFRGSGYGLMFHWTSESRPYSGARIPYPRAVDRFDVESFARMVQGTGAAYVMLTANHADPSFPAPLKHWESLYPGWTTERDLVDEIISALVTRGIKLFLYLNPFAAYIKSGRLRNLDGTRVYDKNLQIHPDCREDYLETTCRLLQEIGDRYGQRLAGYWFDSFYQPLGQFGSFPMEPVFRAAKTGNPDRLTCFNWWIRPVGTQWQEYWAAEVGGPGALPASDDSRIGMTHGAGKGLNGHALLIMDDPWVHTATNTDIVDPRQTEEALIPFIKDCNAKNAPVTVNLGIYQDGGIGPKAAELMSEVRDAIR